MFQVEKLKPLTCDTALTFISETVTPWQDLKVVSTAFLLVCFLHLKESTFETRKNVVYFTSKALFILEIIKF